MSWDERWMAVAELYASWSKDKSRKVGAVIVDERNVQVAAGWNGFPRGVNDNNESRHQRPNKYLWTEHAERNAIYNAAANGNKTLGCVMYLQWFPCTSCARGIIQAGIKEVVCIEPDWEDETYGLEFKAARLMLFESGVIVRFKEGKAPIRKDVLFDKQISKENEYERRRRYYGLNIIMEACQRWIIELVLKTSVL